MMHPSLFDPLANTIESLPPRAIIRTLELQSQMLKDDLANDRPLPVREVESLQSFYHFIKAVKERSPLEVYPATLPLRHLSFYKKTVDRLVTAEELPADARIQFENCFSKTVAGRTPDGGV
jgi:hypothetical protein